MLVVIIDKKIFLKFDDVIFEVNKFEDMEVIVIFVGIGVEIDRKELEEFIFDVMDVIIIFKVFDFDDFGRKIMEKVLKGIG